MSATTTLDKGGRMEEILRKYFLELGYFVVRGARYVYAGIDITDVDLWLYQRASLFSRQRLNVDIKNRRTPHALERVLWTKGLQVGLGLDGSIVATTDSREAIKNYGELQKVAILDGQFLGKLKNRYGTSTPRLAEEDLVAMIRSGKGDRIGIDWIERLAAAKSRILTQLDFDGCNSLLNDCRYFAEQILTVRHKDEAACRLLYLTLALSLVTMDFLTREFTFSEKQLQSDILNDGFRFGTSGRAGADKVFSMAGKVVSAYMRHQNMRGTDLTKQLRQEAEKLHVEILTEFILKSGHGKLLFELARTFESVAFSSTFIAPASLHPDNRGFIGVVLDFFGIDRKQFFDAIVPLPIVSPPTVEPEESVAAQNDQKTESVSPQQLEIQVSGMAAIPPEKQTETATPPPPVGETPI